MPPDAGFNSSRAGRCPETRGRGEANIREPTGIDLDTFELLDQFDSFDHVDSLPRQGNLGQWPPPSLSDLSRLSPVELSSRGGGTPTLWQGTSTHGRLRGWGRAVTLCGMNDLFAYGTLMCEEIMLAVTGCRPRSMPAVLEGFRRGRIRGESYPGLVAAAGCRVEGILYRDLSADGWERLDRFEGEMYARHTVDVQLPDGTMVSAITYLVRPRFLGLVEAAEWDFQAFLQRDKARFEADYRGYDQV